MRSSVLKSAKQSYGNRVSAYTDRGSMEGEQGQGTMHEPSMGTTDAPVRQDQEI